MSQGLPVRRNRLGCISLNACTNAGATSATIADASAVALEMSILILSKCCRYDSRNVYVAGVFYQRSTWPGWMT